MFENLTNENFIMFAMKYYINPHCESIDEFNDDVKRIMYIKKLFGKYKSTGDLKDRLILNHLCIIYNMFESKAATRMLVLKLDDYLDCLKPFLILMGYWTTELGLVAGNPIIDSNIPLDRNIVNVLRNI